MAILHLHGIRVPGRVLLVTRRHLVAICQLRAVAKGVLRPRELLPGQAVLFYRWGLLDPVALLREVAEAVVGILVVVVGELGRCLAVPAEVEHVEDAECEDKGDDTVRREERMSVDWRAG